MEKSDREKLIEAMETLSATDMIRFGSVIAASMASIVGAEQLAAEKGLSEEDIRNEDFRATADVEMTLGGGVSTDDWIVTVRRKVDTDDNNDVGEGRAVLATWSSDEKDEEVA